MSTFLTELRDRSVNCGLSEVPAKMDSIMEAVLYGSALPAYAVEEIDILWSEVTAEEEALLKPPTEEQLSLHHPSFNVE
jgi:hypothetical protein